jgi:hypothetical protein
MVQLMVLSNKLLWTISSDHTGGLGILHVLRGLLFRICLTNIYHYMAEAVYMTFKTQLLESIGTCAQTCKLVIYECKDCFSVDIDTPTHCPKGVCIYQHFGFDFKGHIKGSVD